MGTGENNESSSSSMPSRLPILIVPGFMSSGLYVKESEVKKEWVGQRVWINLVALGFQAAYLNRKDDMVESVVGSDNDSDSDDDEHGDEDANNNDNINEDENHDEENPAQPSNNTDESGHDKVLRNTWIHHMSLQDDMASERKGIQVRNIEGLAGVDYLSPGTLTSLLSYVFGPVIAALKKAGYTEGKDLDAAPYDWRLPPSALETRDQYFSRTLNQIEDMYAKNQNTPVVLLCHSMGCRIGHYLMNFAKLAKGQKWLDKYIHTYCPIGGPHLGAPKALRSFVSGDKMGLDTFLSDSEALVMGRSLGSGPLLLPALLPPESPPNAIVRSDWAVEVSILSAIDTDAFLNKREDEHRPSRMRMTATFSGMTLHSSFSNVDAQTGSIQFDETFQFRTHESLDENVKMRLMLCEPGLSRARKSKSNIRTCHLWARQKFFKRWTCNINGQDAKWGRPPKDNKFLFWLNILTFWWILWPALRYGTELGFKLAFGAIYCGLWCFFEGNVVAADKFSQVSGSTSVTAVGKIKSVRNVLLGTRSTDEAHQVDLMVELVSYRDKTRLFRLCCDKRKTTVTVRLKWISPKSLAHSRKEVDHIICQPTTLKLPVLGKDIKSTKRKNAKYLARSGYDILAAEGMTRIFDHMEQVYKPDPCGPREMSTLDPPPCRVVKAIYGINRSTEVGTIYKRKQSMLLGGDAKAVNIFEPDRQAALADEKDGFKVAGGIIYETKSEERPSGDGTVPYWSLNYVKNWKNDCEVIVDELDRAEHREILADKRLHQLLVDYCCKIKVEM